MVMGPTHAMSGAAVWLTGAAVGGGTIAAAAGGSPAVIILSTAVCAGAALGPDIDSHGATVVNAFGILGRATHEVVNTVSVAVYTATSTQKDRPAKGGHRTLFHTTAMAFVMGGIVSAMSSLPGSVDILGKQFATGQLFSILFMGIFLHLGFAGLFEKQIKKWRRQFGPYLMMLGTAAVTAATAVALPANQTYGWLGLAVGLGWFTHLLGDMITKMGVPMAWPIKIRGKRWYDVSLPSFMRIEANGTMNSVLLYVFTVISIGMIFWMIPPTQHIMSTIWNSIS